MSMYSLLEQVMASDGVGPVTRAMAAWDGRITTEAIARVNELRLLDSTGDRRDGTGRYRGSLLGACDRMQMLSYRGYQGPDEGSESTLIMADGTYRHYFWQEVGLSAGFLSSIEHKAAYAPWRFRGQLDGLGTDHKGEYGLELKTTKWAFFKEVKDYLALCRLHRARVLDPALGDPPKILVKWLTQIGGYRRAIGNPRFVLLVEVRSDRPDWFELVLGEDDTAVDDLARLTFERLARYEQAEVLPPVKPGYPSDNECSYWCSFTAICPSATF